MGLYFQAEKLLNLPTDPICEDKGIIELRSFIESDPRNIWLALVWIVVGCSAGCVDNLLSNAWSKVRYMYEKNHGQVINPFVFSGWIFFTFISLISLLQFGRAQISYFFKFIHVALELTVIIIFLQKWGASGHSLLVLLLAILGLSGTLFFPCDVMYDMTAIGALLDSANFFLCLLNFKRNKVFIAQTLAFFFHATYIWSFLLMAYISSTPTQSLMFRMYGVLANSFAICIGSAAMDIILDEVDSEAEDLRQDSLTSKDTTLFTRAADEYIIPSKNTLFNLSTRRGKLMLILSTLSQGVFHVSEEKSKRQLRVLFLNTQDLQPRVENWQSSYKITQEDIRFGKIIMWATFMFLTHVISAHLRQPITVALAISWFAPTLITSALFYLLWWLHFP